MKKCVFSGILVILWLLCSFGCDSTPGTVNGGWSEPIVGTPAYREHLARSNQEHRFWHLKRDMREYNEKVQRSIDRSNMELLRKRDRADRGLSPIYGTFDVDIQKNRIEWQESAKNHRFECRPRIMRKYEWNGYNDDERGRNARYHQNRGESCEMNKHYKTRQKVKFLSGVMR